MADQYSVKIVGGQVEIKKNGIFQRYIGGGNLINAAVVGNEIHVKRKNTTQIYTVDGVYKREG